MSIGDFLRKISLFDNMPESDIDRVCGIAHEIDLPAGTCLFDEGSPADSAYIIRAGRLEIVKFSNEREILLAVRGVGEVIGEMALLDDAPRSASVRARDDSRLVVISKEQFDQLLESSPTASRAILEIVVRRLKDNFVSLRQSEKLMQLGTLTAGIAHELNNPAAAIQRGAEQLQTAMAQLEDAYFKIDRLGLAPQQADRLRQLADEIPQRRASSPRLDTLALSDREYEIETWLENAGIDAPWEYASIFVSLGYSDEDLAALADQFAPDQFGDVVRWYSAVYAAHSLQGDIHEGAARISEIIKALKTYSYLDQGPVQRINLHEGLDNTLIILHHKLKDIEVQRNYDTSLPEIEAYGSELNQVWTNLIDNAADALEGKGVITLRTRRESDWAVVEVQDNGPGIPPEIQPRIFEAFFTTKPPGKGTGLGLEISYNIVVLRHRGDIKLTSEPGKTCFQVWLPVELER